MQGQGKQRTAFMNRSSLCENLLLQCPRFPYELLIKSQAESTWSHQWGSHAENPPSSIFLIPLSVFVGIKPCNPSQMNPFRLQQYPNTWSLGNRLQNLLEHKGNMMVMSLTCLAVGHHRHLQPERMIRREDNAFNSWCEWLNDFPTASWHWVNWGAAKTIRGHT